MCGQNVVQKKKSGLPIEEIYDKYKPGVVILIMMLEVVNFKLDILLRSIRFPA